MRHQAAWRAHCSSRISDTSGQSRAGSRYDGRTFEELPMIRTRLAPVAFVAIALLALSNFAAPAAASPFDVNAPTRPLEPRLVVGGFDGITSIANAGDARLFVTERPGRVRVVQNGQLQPAPFLDLRSLILSSGGEQGLLSVAFHPLYARNGLFFVFYTDVSGTDTIARYHVSSDPNRAEAVSEPQRRPAAVRPRRLPLCRLRRRRLGRRPGVQCAAGREPARQDRAPGRRPPRRHAAVLRDPGRQPVRRRR